MANPPASLALGVSANRQLCRDHFRLTLCTEDFPAARPGQFLYLGPTVHADLGSTSSGTLGLRDSLPMPFLRRAFSIANLRRADGKCFIDVIYRVVGAGTQWMAGLRKSDQVSAVGPLGNGFGPRPENHDLWFVAGGVGFPPLMWLANSSADQANSRVFFFGASCADFVPSILSCGEDAGRASEIPGCAAVIATDDGSLGVRGTVVDVLTKYADKRKPDGPKITVYTCGPEVMMRAVVEFCSSRSLECYACLERAMACGFGTCQSCVVPVADELDGQGWRYALCCTEGPVFEASRIIWNHP